MIVIIVLKIFIFWLIIKNQTSFYSILIIMEAFVLLNFYPFVKNR
jgi:hypothetical protein